MIYYIRTLKTGEKYITSYKDRGMTDRIAAQETSSTGKKKWEGELYFNLETGKYGADASGVGLVSHIRTESNSMQEGRYAVFSLNSDGSPNDLGLRFGTYGDANKFVRAVVSAYGELFVLEMEKKGKGANSNEGIHEDLSETDEAPF